MTPGAVVAMACWGAVVYFVVGGLWRDLRTWARTQRRGHVRRVPPRPAQIARTREELDRLYERSPHR